jgi:hypothetical protein
MSTYAEIDATLAAPGQFFEIDEIEISEVPTACGRTRRARASFWNDRIQGGDTPFLVLGAEASRTPNIARN